MSRPIEVRIYDDDVTIWQGGDRITIDSVEDLELLIKELQDKLIVMKETCHEQLA